MRLADHHIRLAGTVIIAVGTAAAGVAIFSEQLGLGGELSRGTFGWKRLSLLLVGAAVLVAGALFLTRPHVFHRLVDWERVGRSERFVLALGGLLVAGGAIACGAALLADELRLGLEAARGVFGWKRISLLVAGAIALGGGALLLARPRIVSTRIPRSGRSEDSWRKTARVAPLFPRSPVLLTRIPRPAKIKDFWRAQPVAGRVLLGLIAIAIGINLIQFSEIDDEARSNYRALHAYETSDLFEIAISDDDSARRWVAPFHYLGELLPRSTIVVPNGGVDSWFSFESAAVAFGEARSVVEAPYNPRGMLNLAKLEKYRVDTGSFVPDEGSARTVVSERVSFYVDGKPSGTVVVLTPDGPPGRYEPMAFVDASVLHEEQIPDLGASDE